ncbi:MAG: hypothetical protein R3264_20850, partial [Anaerolineae bacterium]|nr:hypothetical protein [Anaerolineae bacterium]
MELKQYGHIIWKRAWIPALLLLVVAGVSWLTYDVPPPTYTTSMRFTVGVEPQEVEGQYSYDSYYAWLSSEYLIDNLTLLVSSQNFAADVNRHLMDMGSPVTIPPGIIAADKQHRVLRLTVNWGDVAQLADIARAIMLAVETDSAKYFPQSDTAAILIEMIDQPSPPAPVSPSLTRRLDIPVRLLLALGAGLALTFL